METTEHNQSLPNEDTKPSPSITTSPKEKLLNTLKNRKFLVLGLLVFLLFIIIGFSLYLYDPLYNPKGINLTDEYDGETYIDSYEECIIQHPGYKDKYICSTGYRSDEDSNSFNLCKENDGKVRCPSNAPIAEDCSLGYNICSMSFYNPNFVFPLTYEECRKVALSGGSFHGINDCTITVSRTTTVNKQYAKELVDKCIELGGYEDGEMCSYIVIEPEPERKEEVAEECKEMNLTQFENSSIQKVCDWALSTECSELERLYEENYKEIDYSCNSDNDCEPYNIGVDKCNNMDCISTSSNNKTLAPYIDELEIEMTQNDCKYKKDQLMCSLPPSPQELKCGCEKSVCKWSVVTPE